MRIWLSMLIPLILGITVGVGTTRQEFLNVQEQFDVHYDGVQSIDPILTTPLDAPKAQVVKGIDFDFGTMSRNESRIHNFLIKNVGAIPLDVNFHLVSCGKCMFTEFESQFVPPDETVEIAVRYSTRKPVARFREWIEIGTSDTTQEVIRFTITGNVSESISLSDDKLVVDNVISNEVNTSTFQIYSFLTDRLEITDYKWSNSSTADLFDIEFRPIDPSKLEAEPPAKAALEAVITIKPGLPVGAITQSLLMTAQTDKPVELEMPITGSVVSDISIIGASNFTRDRNLLDLGRVPRDQGKSQTLRILLKGPNRHDAELRIASVDPETALKVTIGEPNKNLNNGAVYMYPLEIEVPPGAPAFNRLGSVQGKLAKIVIETNLSTAKQVIIYVRVATE